MGPCWQCGTPQVESLFCKLCNALQRPTPDYYRLFGIKPRLAIEVKELERRFYDMSRMLHPDRFLQRAPTEQTYSLEATAILNDGYRTLRDPVKRAEYMLKQHGFASSEPRSKNVPPELLEEVFELNMALEELRGGDPSARPQLEEARQRFSSLRGEADSEMEALFKEFDATQDTAVLSRLRRVLDRRKYISNLVGEVEKELAA
jgi:molecular chaperone HscB